MRLAPLPPQVLSIRANRDCMDYGGIYVAETFPFLMCGSFRNQVLIVRLLELEF